MPVLKNPKHERFAQNVATGMTATDAYLSAGYETDATAARVSATRLLANVTVRDRVNELLELRGKKEIKATEKAIEKAALTKAWVITRLMKNAQQALGEIPTPKTIFDKETGERIDAEVIDIDRAAANKALELLGKTMAQFIERKEVGEPGEFAQMSNDELREHLRREAETLQLWAQGTPASGRNGKAGKSLNWVP